VLLGHGVRHSAYYPRQRLRQQQVPIGTAPNTGRFRWSSKELTHGSRQKDDTFAKDGSTQEDWREAQHRAQEHKARRAKALVATRD
jgi:hypothetical protein